MKRLPLSNAEIKLISMMCNEEIERCIVTEEVFNISDQDRLRLSVKKKACRNLLNRLLMCAINPSDDIKPMEIRPELN